MTPYDWMDDALCRQISPDIFHPTVQEQSIANKAKKVCVNCPVISNCLDYALSMPGITGIYAGTTEKERRQMRRREYREAKRTESVRPASAAG